MFSKAFAKASELSEKAAAVANESLEKAQQAAKNSSTVQQISAATADEHCSQCGRAVSVVQKATKQASIHHCRVCDQLFCDKCCRKTDAPIPTGLWNPIRERPEDGIGFVCTPRCFGRCVDQWVRDIAESLRVPFEAHLLEYLCSASTVAPATSFYPRPGALQDTRKRQALRMAITAARVADAVGYSTYLKIAKAAMTGGFGVQMFLSGEQFKMFIPLLETLRSLGIMDPNGLLQLYYLSCWHMIHRRQNPSTDRILHSQGVEGVICEISPPEFLRELYHYAPAAQWLYKSALPPPHDEVEWSNWYLTCIVKREKWVVIACSSQTTELPNGINCPAFALVARVVNGYKESLLVVRGTASAVDWKINLRDTVTPFTYCEGADGSLDVVGSAHEGMISGAREILKAYGIKGMVFKLMTEGFSVKTVGHSLGASTAMFLAAELNNGLVDVRRQMLSGGAAPPDESNIWADAARDPKKSAQCAWLRDLRAPFPRINSIGFGMPPCVSENVADAMRRDSMVTVVVNCDDGVPRFSRVNILKMAMELRTTDAPAEKWKQEDQATVKMYLESYGKARDFVAEDLSTDADEKKSSNAASSKKAGGIDSDEEDGPHALSEKDKLKLQKAKVKEDELASKRAEEMALLRKRLDESTYLVLPGNIVHLYRDNGILATSVVDHRFSPFRGIQLFQGIGEDHSMHNYRLSIADAMRWRGLIQEQQSEGKSDDVRRPPEWQTGLDSDGKWRKCSVCDCDPTWPCITRSDASRSTVTHNCRLCGSIVCSVCSPAGDDVPGEGVGTFERLDDMRIPLPSLGLYSPQRVCLPCYMSNNH